MEQRTLQDRIFKYNVLLILIPVFIVSTIATLSIIFVLSYIERESVNENASYVEEYFDSLNEENFSIPEIDRTLDQYGFSLRIERNGVLLVEEDDIPFIESVVANDDTSIMIKMGYTIVSRTIINDGDRYVVIASSFNSINNVSPRVAFRIIVWGIVISALLVLLVIIHLTRKLTKSLKEPIEIIIDGSKNVKEGNLDVKLQYDAQEYEEFIRVCDAFNEMVSKLKENIEATEQIYQDRKVLIAGISHDLKTPLTAIKGYSKGIIDGIAATPEKQQKYIQTIYDKACVMEELFNQLMLVSDLQTQTLHLNKRSVNVKNYLDSLVKDLISEYENRMKINYSNSCTYQKWNIDESQFGRILVNLFGNSEKYNDKENIVIDINCYSDDSSIVIEFKDNGPGVPEDKIEKIFDLFYRTDEARTTPQNGSGLGLAITKQIVEMFDGNVEAKNESGLKIIIKIPMEV